MVIVVYVLRRERYIGCAFLCLLGLVLGFLRLVRAYVGLVCLCEMVQMLCACEVWSMFWKAFDFDFRSLMFVVGLAVHITIICCKVGSTRMPRIIIFIFA